MLHHAIGKSTFNSANSRFSVGGVANGATSAVSGVAGQAGNLGQNAVGEATGGANKLGQKAPQKQGGGALAPVEGIVGGVGGTGMALHPSLPSLLNENISKSSSNASQRVTWWVA